jgi:glyoxylase I family protein
VLLEHPVSGLLIELLQHPTTLATRSASCGPASTTWSSKVAGRDELEQWQERLTSLGIAHSGIKDHLITFRDPDNIQLEFFWPKPSS